jgi:NADH-quinone oxidoreductase subunit A
VYAGIAAMAAVGVLGVLVLVWAHRGTAVSPDPWGAVPFDSGWLPEQHALSRYHARWYPATIVFLAFDVEMLFMYPWAVVVADLGAKAVIEMFLFLAALLVAVVWAKREGALRWT